MKKNVVVFVQERKIRVSSLTTKQKKIDLCYFCVTVLTHFAIFDRI